MAARVSQGGHSIPEDVIRRRYASGLLNFFRLYRPLADAWRFYDNSAGEPRLVASDEEVLDGDLWNRILQENADEG